MTQSPSLHSNQFTEKAYGNYLPNHLSSKAYGKEDISSKPLSSDPSLAQWYEENIQYWRDVQGGKIQVSQQEFQELEQWFAYAEQHLGVRSSSWGNDSSSGPGNFVPKGAEQGPTGNSNITDPKNSEFTADGSTSVVDAWVDFTVDIPPPCTGTAETTLDNRNNPPEQVTKIIVTNPSVRDAKGNPAQTVIFVHDACKVTANVSSKGDGTSRFVDHSGTVTLGQYTGQADGAGSPQGDQPDTVDSKNNTRTWKTKDSVDYDVSEGKETDRIYANSLNLTPPDRTYTVWVEKTGEHAYHIQIEDAQGNTVRTIEASQIHQLNLNVDADNLYFKDSSKNAKNPAPQKSGSNQNVVDNEIYAPALTSNDGFKTWSDKSHDPDKNITVESGAEEGSTPAGNDPNPQPDSISQDGKTAQYNKSASQDLTAFYDGEYSNNHISSGPGGTVDLHGASFADKVDITNNNNGTYTIVFTSGDDASKKITYTVDGPPDKITINDVNAGHVTYNGQPYATGVDELISVTGEKENPLGNLGKLPPALINLINITGVNFDAFAGLLQKHFPAEFIAADENHDGKLTPDELADAINTNKVSFPPAKPSKDMIEFFYDLDPVFKKDADDAHSDRSKIKDGSRRLVDLMKASYPDQAGTINYTGNDHKNDDDGKGDCEYPELTWNDISFGNFHFNWTTETGKDREKNENGDNTRFAHADLGFTTF